MVSDSRPEQWNVLEVSSFQLETIDTFRAKIGLVTNVTPDHLDRHHTMEAYVAAKGLLFQNQTADDFAVLNADDPACLAYAGAAQSRVLWFSLAKPVSPGLWLERGKILFDGELLMDASEIPLRGRHNIENTMAAAAAARLAGAQLTDIAAAVRSFPGVEHRLEFVRKVREVAYYNDSKATNVDATMKAVDAFEGGLWIILGGKDKGSDYRTLRDPLRAKARAALLIGKAAPIITEHLGDAVPIIQCGDLATAIRTGYEAAVAGDTVLLAPACASFDQFQSFEHRGRVFKELVAGLEE
jgi:UDP-N-acetylmuramoylalanine--D-glutamate ligase